MNCPDRIFVRLAAPPERPEARCGSSCRRSGRRRLAIWPRSRRRPLAPRDRDGAGGDRNLRRLGRADAGPPRGVRGLELVDTGFALDWLDEDPARPRQSGGGIARLARAPGRPRPAQHAALAAEARFDMPVVVVHHGCVATWWQAVHGARSPPISPGAPAWCPRPRGRRSRSWRRPRPSARWSGLLRPRRAAAHRPPRPHALRDPARGPARFRVHRRPAVGRGKNLGTIDAAAAGLAVPVRAAGPLDGPDGAGHVRQHPLPRHARRGGAGRAGFRRGRSSSRPRSTSRSALPCWKRPRPAARSSCPTSRPSASCGTNRDLRSRRATSAPSPTRSPRWSATISSGRCSAVPRGSGPALHARRDGGADGGALPKPAAAGPGAGAGRGAGRIRLRFTVEDRYMIRLVTSRRTAAVACEARDGRLLDCAKLRMAITRAGHFTSGTDLPDPASP